MNLTQILCTYTLIKSPNASNPSGYFKFIIDPGSGISVVQKSALIENIFYDSDKVFQISGINQSPIQSMGETKVILEINKNSERERPFQILDIENGIPYDGLIGNNFLRTCCTSIDYENKVLYLKEPKEVLRFYIFSIVSKTRKNFIMLDKIKLKTKKILRDIN